MIKRPSPGCFQQTPCCKKSTRKDNGTEEKGSFGMARDDWKYYDEDMEEGDEEKEKVLPPEKQCNNCLHWVQREAPSCSWCGKPFDDDGGRS